MRVRVRRHGYGMKRNDWNRLQFLRRLADQAHEWIPSDRKMRSMTVEELYAELRRLEPEWPAVRRAG